MYLQSFRSAFTPHSFDLNMAVLVISSSLGEIRKNWLNPPCSPKEGTTRTFNERHKPACYFVAKIYRHVDMLDDDTRGVREKATYSLCVNGKARECIFLFFFMVGGEDCGCFFQGLFGWGFGGIKEKHELVPLVLQRVEFS